MSFTLSPPLIPSLKSFLLQNLSNTCKTGPTAIKNTCNFSTSTLHSPVYSSKDQASPFSYNVTH